jgi:predicted SAM-dependent methyltransferase
MNQLNLDCLNLGCGDRFHSAWTNINFVSTGKGVIAHNLNDGIPFPNRSFDVVYHSHVLEHFSKANAKIFIRECKRVLRPQGVLRIAVPDLEVIAKTYLDALEKASNGSEAWAHNYEWMLLEMYDQTVRNQSGGEMLSFLSSQDMPNPEFATERCGVEVQKLILAAQTQKTELIETPDNAIVKLAKHVYRLWRYANYRHRAMLKLILKLILSPMELEALKIGQFRASGEIHQWMYDRYSLSVLLSKSGFERIMQRSASESYISEWTSFNLDTEPDGSIYKPDSLYMEAIAPDL